MVLFFFFFYISYGDEEEIRLYKHLKRGDEDDRVGKPRAHLFTQTHQKFNDRERSSLKTAERQAEELPSIKGIKGTSHQDA